MRRLISPSPPLPVTPSKVHKKGNQSMTRKIFAFAAILAALVVLQAQTPKTVTIEGYIIDNACADGHKADATFAATVKKHSKSCALMDNCVTSGYAVLTSDAKLYKLDKAGNE